MIFTIFYNNRPDIRENAIKLLLDGIRQGYNFAVQNANTPFFTSQPNWPNNKDIFNLPLNIQCEELEFSENNLISRRMLVIDSDFIIKPEESIIKESVSQEIKKD